MVEIREMRKLGREGETDNCEQRKEEVCMEQRKNRRGYVKNEMFYSSLGLAQFAFRLIKIHSLEKRKKIVQIFA